MNIFSFSAHFESEESCKSHFKEERDKVGVVCKRCSHTEHYWIKSRWSYDAKNVEVEHHSEAEQLCKAPIYLF